MFLGLKYMPAAVALHKRQKFHHGNVSIYNHRKDERNEPKTQNHNFIELLVWESFKRDHFRQKELFI